jgi:hypothetical protein
MIVNDRITVFHLIPVVGTKIKLDWESIQKKYKKCCMDYKAPNQTRMKVDGRWSHALLQGHASARLT